MAAAILTRSQALRAAGRNCTDFFGTMLSGVSFVIGALFQSSITAEVHSFCLDVSVRRSADGTVRRWRIPASELVDDLRRRVLPTFNLKEA